MGHNSKERLFEVMGKVNNDFNNGLNEVFGWSKKEKESKANQQAIEAAKQEAQEYNFNRWGFQPGHQDNFEEGKRVRINGIKQELPKIAALMPELFDTNQGAVEINSKYDVPTYVPLKWGNLILNQNREIDQNVAVENINKLLDQHSQKMGIREDDVINEGTDNPTMIAHNIYKEVKNLIDNKTNDGGWSQGAEAAQQFYSDVFDALKFVLYEDLGDSINTDAGGAPDEIA